MQMGIVVHRNAGDVLSRESGVLSEASSVGSSPARGSCRSVHHEKVSIMRSAGSAVLRWRLRVVLFKSCLSDVDKPH